MRRALKTVHVALLVIGLGAFAHATVAAQAGAQKTPAPTLKDRIEFGLETSTIVRKYDITVKVSGSEAVLTGTVATADQKAEAVRLAKVAGATKVQDAIVVNADADRTVSERIKSGLTKTGDKISDAWITTKVKWFYWGDERLRGSDISVTTTDRVVTLKGTVRDLDGRTRAVQLATDTEGVRRVIDELTIAK